MIAFEILVNGDRVCTAGVESDFGMLTTVLSWTKRDLDRLPDEIRSEVPAEELKMIISGQKSLDEKNFENLQWQGRELKPGDEVRIRIIHADQVDAPESSKKIHPKYVQKKRSGRLLH
jgi:DNA-directed RNA polymerase subunit E'/Rpb7